jgi:hypothetical protein
MNNEEATTWTWTRQYGTWMRPLGPARDDVIVTPVGMSPTDYRRARAATPASAAAACLGGATPQNGPAPHPVVAGPALPVGDAAMPEMLDEAYSHFRACHRRAAVRLNVGGDTHRTTLDERGR